MAQPDYVPVSPGERVRETDPLPPPKAWKVDRPGELPGLRPPEGDAFGKPGPDQGYALTLAKRFTERLQLTPGEHRADAVAGCVAVALKRASMFGRAPVIYDLEIAFGLFGFLDASAPPALVQWRRGMFDGASHDYWEVRSIVDAVPESTLQLTPAEVKQQAPAGWQSLLSILEG